MLQHFPDTTERIDWSILAHFTPIDYRKPEARDSADISIVEQVSKLFPCCCICVFPQLPIRYCEISFFSKVMSRFHRGDFISHKTSKAYESWMNAKESIAMELGIDYHQSPEVFKVHAPHNVQVLQSYCDGATASGSEKCRMFQLGI